MKLSLCNEVIRDMEFDRQCAFAASLGYDALEIAPFTLSDSPEQLSASEIAGFQRALKNEGIVCSSLHWLLIAPEGLSITDADDAVHQRTIDVMRRLVDLAGELGADALVHGSPKQRMLPVGGEDAARDRALNCFRAAAEAAEAAGVVYCVEPLASAETNFVNTLDDAAKVVAAVNSPAFRSMIDCAATGREGLDVVDQLEKHFANGLIAHVQVNDPNKRGPGQGDMTFAPFLSALRQQGYDGWVAFEPFDYVPDGPACAARSIGYIQGVIEGLT